jgi:hypothetical protein
VDSAGATSSVITSAVRGTATWFSYSKTASKIRISGQVRPNRNSERVHVRLLRKSGRSFRAFANRFVILTGTSRFQTAFGRPMAGTCRIEALYPGDRQHLSSMWVKTFAC